uniref:Ig-like domain-containing protein n=1 Tax=Mastacembelus armatus TaxID=205130 RepID=A0A7N8Y7R6_9TELE
QGSTARLQCTVKGSPELHTTWFLNNNELSAGGRYVISLKDGVSTLEVQDLTLSDSGNYTCEVLNESGCESCSTKVTNEAGQQKCDAVLTIQEPARILDKAASISVTAGDSATLQCTISGSPELKVKWFKDGKEMINHRHTMSFDSSIATLVVERCSVEDSGDYVCVASSEAGRDQCSSSVSVKGWFSLVFIHLIAACFSYSGSQ